MQQPQPGVNTSLTSDARVLAMERVIIAVRRLWFGGKVAPQGWATLLSETGGDLVTLVDADLSDLEQRLPGLAARGVYVVVTDHSRPRDLGPRLRRAGFSLVQRHGAYVLDPQIYGTIRAQGTPIIRRRGLLSLFGRAEPHPPVISQIGEAQLQQWNEVCWRAFGCRGSEASSLLEKETAFHAMGSAARWYLATVRDRPAATAICYRTAETAQILAVGTLPAHRGRGIASTLLHRVITDWQQDSNGLLFLDTSPGGQAERIYLRMGFRLAYTREIYSARR